MDNKEKQNLARQVIETFNANDYIKLLSKVIAQGIVTNKQLKSAFAHADNAHSFAIKNILNKKKEYTTLKSVSLALRLRKEDCQNLFKITKKSVQYYIEDYWFPTEEVKEAILLTNELTEENLSYHLDTLYFYNKVIKNKELKKQFDVSTTEVYKNKAKIVRYLIKSGYLSEWHIEEVKDNKFFAFKFIVNGKDYFFHQVNEPFYRSLLNEESFLSLKTETKAFESDNREIEELSEEEIKKWGFRYSLLELIADRVTDYTDR